MAPFSKCASSNWHTQRGDCFLIQAKPMQSVFFFLFTVWYGYAFFFLLRSRVFSWRLLIVLVNHLSLAYSEYALRCALDADVVVCRRNARDVQFSVIVAEPRRVQRLGCARPDEFTSCEMQTVQKSVWHLVNGRVCTEEPQEEFEAQREHEERSK